MKRLAIVLCLLLSAPAAFSQTGFPLYGSFQSGQSDSVNLQNLNTNFSIPLVSTPGRNGTFGISLVYNSLMWSPSIYGWMPGVPGAAPNGGWTTTNPIGSVTYGDTVTNGTCGRCYAGGDCDGYKLIELLNNYAYVDPAGTPHGFSGVYAKSTYTSCTDSTTYLQNLTGYSDDGLYYINLTSNPPSTILVWSSMGTKLDLTNYTATDRNGNYFQGGAATWTDSAGHTSLRTVTSGSNVEYHYYDTSGTDRNFTLKYQNYSVMTNFGCSGVSEYNSSGTLPQISLPYELDLPNGRTYSISYEGTPGHSGYVTGRVAQITLPTGGSYQYQYSGSNDGINCSDATITNLTRIVSDGGTSNTWSYARTSISGAAGITTVTAPTLPYDSAGNQTVYTFNSSGQQTQELDYQASSTLLRTVNSTWAANGSPATRVTILPSSQQSEVDTAYDTHGHLTQMNNHDFGSGATGSLLRETDLSYSTISAPVSFLLPSQKLIKDGSGTVKYREDYAYDGSTPTCVTGAAQHDDTNYGCSYYTRGNMTSLTTYTDAATPSGGVTSSATYDVLGNVLTASVAGTLQKQFAYTSTTNYAYPDSVVSGPSGGPQLTVSATYNSNTGQLASLTDANGQVTSYSYDSLKRLTTATRPDSVSLTTTYNDSAVTVTQSTPIDGSNTLKVVTAYDGLGRPVTATSQDGSSTTYSIVQTIYDPVGRPYKTSNPYTSSPSYWTESRFDSLGRPLTAVLQDSAQSTVSYSGNCSTATDPASKARKSCFDGLGRLQYVFEPDPANWSSLSIGTEYLYNVLDQLILVYQNAQNRYYVYDGMGRLTDTLTPEASSGWTHFDYNSFSLLTQRTDRRGVITSYSYDSLNRPYQISYNVGSTGITNPGTITYTYGTSSASFNNGRLTQMSDGTGSEGYTYDLLGRVTQLSKTLWSSTYNIGYTYNYAGELTQITYPSGRTVAQNYDAIGRLCSITNGSTGCSPSSYYATSFGYTTAQQVSGFNYGNGVAASFGYSSDRLQLTSLGYAKSGTTLFSLSYGYTSGQSNNGQITNVADNVDSGRNSSYSYDALARLSAASTSGSSGFPQWGLSWTYDIYGNRTAQTVTAGSAPSNSLSVSTSTNQITNTGFSYDANGNMTNDGVNALVYDAENHLFTSTGTGGTGGYLYDGNGLRVEKCVGNCSGATTYAKIIYSGAKPIAEYSTATGLTEYIYSGGALLATIDSSGTRYHHPDHLSPRVTTDSSGNVIGQQGHYPFGELWYPTSGSPSTKYQFTTYERDTESGNDYAQARYDINRLGRFNSPDPLAGHIGDPQSLNRYSYVRNGPIDFEDPSGMKTTCSVAFTPHSDGSLGINISGPRTDDGDDDSLTELLEPPESCGNPNCTVILDGATAPCVFAFGGGGGGGTGSANDSVMFIKCPVDNPFYTGGCVGLQLDPDGNGKWIAWVPKGRLVTASVDGTSAGTTAFMDGNYWAWQTGPIPQGTVMNSCSDAESCALSIFFPQVSRPIPPSDGGGGRGYSPQEGLEAIHNAGNIAAPINNPAFPAIWYGSQLGSFGLTYVAPLVPPALTTLHTVALGCALSDNCRDNVMDGVVGLIPDADDGRMPTTPVGWAFFIYSRIHQ
jgi:RHS repeat-associated protein